MPHPDLQNELEIAHFDNGIQLSYANGNKDIWCVYKYSDTMPPTPPRDEDYFQELKDLADEYGTNYVYCDFVNIYDRTVKEKRSLSPDVLEYIRTLAATRYAVRATDVAILFTILYMAMVAEFYYVSPGGYPSRLNKRIKRLGVHQILIVGLSISDAANYSRGRSFAELDDLCTQYGF